MLLRIPNNQLITCVALQRLLKGQQKLVLLDDTRKFKNIFMASESASIHTYLMSGFLTFIYTKLEVVFCTLYMLTLCRLFLICTNLELSKFIDSGVNVNLHAASGWTPWRPLDHLS